MEASASLADAPDPLGWRTASMPELEPRAGSPQLRTAGSGKRKLPPSPQTRTSPARQQRQHSPEEQREEVRQRRSSLQGALYIISSSVLPCIVQRHPQLLLFPMGNVLMFALTEALDDLARWPTPATPTRRTDYKTKNIVLQGKLEPCGDRYASVRTGGGYGLPTALFTSPSALDSGAHSTDPAAAQHRKKSTKNPSPSPPRSNARKTPKHLVTAASPMSATMPLPTSPMKALSMPDGFVRLAASASKSGSTSPTAVASPTAGRSSPPPVASLPSFSAGPAAVIAAPSVEDRTKHLTQLHGPQPWRATPKGFPVRQPKRHNSEPHGSKAQSLRRQSIGFPYDDTGSEQAFRPQQPRVASPVQKWPKNITLSKSAGKTNPPPASVARTLSLEQLTSTM